MDEKARARSFIAYLSKTTLMLHNIIAVRIELKLGKGRSAW
jgi:hypothetical protein